MILTQAERDWFTSYLAEGMHTAFRKGSDSNRSQMIHGLIDALPEDEWDGIVSFVAEAMLDGIEAKWRRSEPIEPEVGEDG
jgi:hypothetical protein